MAQISAAAAREALGALVRERATPAGATWIAGQLEAPEPAALVLAQRSLGRKPLVAAFADRDDASVSGPWGEVPVGEWTLAEAAQVLLLAAFADAQDAPYETLFQTYDRGDTETRVTALRALNFVRGDAETVPRGLDLVLDAGRTYLTQLMRAGWCGNPFSARHLSDHDYRKAVLKAFFCNVPVEGFQRLAERADAQLAESLCEYIDERLAAGRAVPSAIWPIAALHPQPGLVARLIGNLEHPSADERRVAAQALGNARDPRSATFLQQRLEREQDADVRAALEAAASALSQEA